MTSRPAGVFSIVERRTEVRNVLAYLWDLAETPKLRKPDWLALERAQRLILAAYRDGALNASEALTHLDEALAAVTGRGNELPEADL